MALGGKACETRTSGAVVLFPRSEELVGYAALHGIYEEPERRKGIGRRSPMPKPSTQPLRISSTVIREQVHQLDAIGAAFLAPWLVLAVIAALVVLVYATVF